MESSHDADLTDLCVPPALNAQFSATFTPTPVIRMSTAAQAVVTAANVAGSNSASWNPVVEVAVPGAAVAGTYSATITRSVS